MDLIADTTLLIGIWRGQDWATSFARSNPQTMGLPWIVLAEFWQGAIRAGHATKVVNQFLALGMPLFNAEPVVLVYAELCSCLQVKSYYKGIGQNDLWIAAVSLAYNKPLVTRNRRHFARIDGLDLQVLAP